MAMLFKNRKAAYTLLFVVIILLQLALFYVWNEKNCNQKKLENAFLQKNKTNVAATHFDNALYHFFNAESNFNSYFQEYNPMYLKEYRNSVITMSMYLDSLQNLVATDKRMQPYILKKQKTEDTVLALKKKLDELIDLQIIPLESDYKSQNALHQSTNKEIKSLRYDIAKISNKVKKKRMLARIIDAIRNNENANKEELVVKISKILNSKSKSGNQKDDIKNLLLATDKYYATQFNTLKGTYKNLKNKDKELILVNRYIIDNCQVILSKYSNALKDIEELNFTTYYNQSNKQSTIIFTLLGFILLLTLILLLYTWYAYDYGKKLVSAKAEIENNLEFKNRLIGMLSHEMKAPLNIISNFTETIKNNNKNEALDETVNSLLFTSNSLQLTVSQILNFFKNENNKLVLYKSDINLNQEIKSITSSLKSLADAKKLNLIVKSNKNLDIEVLADNGKIHQLFYNIIGNAIKFTDKGAITVESKATKVKDKIKLEVTINDTGIGIPEDDLKHVFDQYYQSKSESTVISLGAGLGLNLCKEIVTLHGGEIEVKSELNRGTQISFYLLLEKTNDKKQSNKNKLLHLAENKTIKVAFVDDDVLITTILKKLLNDINFVPIAFHSANEIKSYLQKNTVDIIITDLEISGYSGLELIKEIKEIKNVNATTPIIVITGNDYMKNLYLEKEAVDDVIIKPIDREEFYTKLLQLIK